MKDGLSHVAVVLTDDDVIYSASGEYYLLAASFLTGCFDTFYPYQKIAAPTVRSRVSAAVLARTAITLILRLIAGALRDGGSASHFRLALSRRPSRVTRPTLPSQRPFHACYKPRLPARRLLHLKGQSDNDTLLSPEMSF